MANVLIKDLRKISKGFAEKLEEWPHIPCPTCVRGVLRPAADSFVNDETITSKSLHHHEVWDPEWIQGDFLCILTCPNATCDRVRVIGESRVRETGDWYGEQYEWWLTPTMFFPALPLIQSRSLCPKEVGNRVDIAAKILWLDPSSAANRIRSAVEALMDEHGIIRYKPSRRAKPSRISLDERISTFKTALPQHAEAADMLLAVKWIGNVGSHEGVLRILDVLEGVEFLDHALSLIYDTNHDDIKKRAAEVTARRGRPSSSTFSASS
ncbi:DUF4145 domain-containing protein [[Kitasatospora] papulosa]|uniref:DUF4145 domain-containing protein n=1 Tax=[Kitasatospora] papulosa TaxID=1464011 RepID=UPI002E2E1E3D|nr:DUF4145 domain-containing protein [[Kitasatospora] papulosa]